MKHVLPATLILSVCLGVAGAGEQALRENAEQARSGLKAGVEASRPFIFQLPRLSPALHQNGSPDALAWITGFRPAASDR